MTNPTKNSSASLRSSARWLCGVLGVLAIAAAFAMSYLPPQRLVVERDAKEQTMKSTVSSSDTTTQFTALVISGFALLIYDLNGYRIIHFSAGGLKC